MNLTKQEVIYIFLLFHIAVPLFFFEVPLIKRNFKVNRLALIIGSVFPDIVDKLTLFLGLGSGRGYAHSFLFVFTSFLILFLFTKRNKSQSIPFLIGMLFHLILDIGPYLPLFWPFISYNFGILDDPIGVWLEALFTNPLILSTELFGLIFLLFILFKYKLYTFTRLKNFLKTNNEISIRKNNNKEKLII